MSSNNFYGGCELDLSVSKPFKLFFLEAAAMIVNYIVTIIRGVKNAFEIILCFTIAGSVVALTVGA